MSLKTGRASEGISIPSQSYCSTQQNRHEAPRFSQFLIATSRDGRTVFEPAPPLTPSSPRRGCVDARSNNSPLAAAPVPRQTGEGVPDVHFAPTLLREVNDDQVDCCCRPCVNGRNIGASHNARANSPAGRAASQSRRFLRGVDPGASGRSKSWLISQIASIAAFKR